MDISVFHNFLVLAETLSYTKAAEELFISESVLSRQISKFEHELGLKLFNRSTKSVSLTPVGKIYANGLLNVRKNYTAVLEEASAIQNGYTGEIKIAFLPGQTLHDNFIEVLLAFERDYPNILISLSAYNLGEQRSMLQDQLIDFALGATRDFSYQTDFECEIVGNSKNYIVLPKNHNKAQNIDGLKLIDFKDETFILSSESEMPFTMTHFPNLCEQFGFKPKCIVAPNLSTLMIWLEVQRGIAPLDETHVFRDNKKLVFHPVFELGYTEKAIIYNKMITKTCNKTFIDYVHAYQFEHSSNAPDA